MRAEIDHLIADFVDVAHTYFQALFAQLEQKYLPLIESGDITADMLIYLVHRDYQQLAIVEPLRKKFSDGLFLAFLVGYPMSMGVALQQLNLINALLIGDKALMQHLLFRVGEALRLGKITQTSQLVSLLSHVLEVSQTQAAMIATTEYHRIAIKGLLYNWEQAGITKVRFVTAEDERVCHQCNQHNGKIFQLSKIKGMVPIHINCRCSWEEVAG